ncbi:MAG: WG repeat-containing protein, partial [Planctomycetota bacterium]
MRIQSAFFTATTALMVLDVGAAAAERPEKKKHPALWRVEVGGKYGYVDATGEFVIKPTFRYSRGFSEGLAAFGGGGARGYKLGYIDATGKVVIEPRFDGAGPFHEGRAAVRVDGKYGYIDRTGSYVTEPRFNDAKRFSEGLARVNVGGKPDGIYGYRKVDGGKWGYVDR